MPRFASPQPLYHSSLGREEIPATVVSVTLVTQFKFRFASCSGFFESEGLRMAAVKSNEDSKDGTHE